ncbi:MAG: anthranilate synthase component I family protein [Sphingobacteriales bacterium]|nr:MAG: anthranilate synthase component I family protein [Sphingobacteriales bacterium]
MLNWANQFSIFCMLDNNQYEHETAAFECILAAGSKRQLLLQKGDAYQQLQSFYEARPCWLFGHLGYGLKNETENLESNKKEWIDFGLGFFFEPEILLRLDKDSLRIDTATGNAAAIFDSIEKMEIDSTDYTDTAVTVENGMTRQQYIDAVEALLQHIKRGDCYEINFCQPFYAGNVQVDPLQVYKRLMEQSPNPFAALYKLNDKYCVCASPERYLKKTGQILISQPIKGTSKRNYLDELKDEANKNYLQQSQKEKSENVMVVDLVRNDLSRVCEEGSVFVKELFAVYSFPQVHQMISTIQGTLRKDIHFTEAIQKSFPMGSMTGAPKKRVMELIEEYERVGRGLFSGSIGYITPDADFDFNVVIRSIFYDETKQLLSFSAGSGITFYSEPAAEYEECLLKAEAIRKVLK